MVKKKFFAGVVAAAMCIMQVVPTSIIVSSDVSRSVTIEADDIQGKPGDEIDVNISLTENPAPGISSIRMTLNYDQDVLTCVSVSDKHLFGTDSVIAGIPSKTGIAKPQFSIGWSILDQEVADVTSTGLLATIKFKIKEDIDDCESQIKFSYDEVDNYLFYNDTHVYDSVGINFKGGNITVESPKSTDSTLKSLEVSEGKLKPDFDPAVTEYTVELPVDATTVPTVTAEKNDAKASDPVITQATGLEEGKNVATVVVTAEDKSETTYKVTFIRIKSSNNDLASLTVSEGTLIPDFDKTKTEYSVTVPYGSAVPTVEATPDDADRAKVEITQAKDFDKNNKATVKVTAENGDVKTYTVTFTQAAQGTTAAPVITAGQTEPVSRADGTIVITATEDNCKIYYTTDGTEPTENSTLYTGEIKISSLGIKEDVDTVTVKAIAVAENKKPSEVATKEITLKSVVAKLSKIVIDDSITFEGDNLAVWDEVAFLDAKDYNEALKYVNVVQSDYHSWKISDDKTVNVNAIAEKGKITIKKQDGTIVESPEFPYTLTISEDMVDPKIGGGDYIDIIVSPDDEQGEAVTYRVVILIWPCEHVDKTSTVTKAAGCINSGLEDIVCNDCGEKWTDQTVDALGHEFNDGNIVINAPTCTEDGEMYIPCSRPNCDAPADAPAKKDLIVADKLGHDWGEWEVNAEGTAMTRKCSRCDKTETVEITPAEDGHIHDFSVVGDTVKEPTCVEEGLRTLKCSVEGCEETIEETIPTVDHNVTEEEGEYTEIIPATCTADGHAVVRCTVCGEVVLDVILPAQHTYVYTSQGASGHTAKCSVCGAEKTLEAHNGDPCTLCGYETPDAPPTPSDPTPVAPETAKPAAPSVPVWTAPAAPESPESIVNAQFEDKFQISYSNAVEGISGKVVVSKNGSKVTASFDSSLNGMFANLYDPDGNFVSAAEIKNNKAKLNGENANRGWKIIVDEEAHGEDVSAEAGEIVMMDNVTGKSVSYAVPAVIIALIAIAADILIVRKRVSKK